MRYYRVFTHYDCGPIDVIADDHQDARQKVTQHLGDGKRTYTRRIPIPEVGDLAGGWREQETVARPLKKWMIRYSRNRNYFQNYRPINAEKVCS